MKKKYFNANILAGAVIVLLFTGFSYVGMPMIEAFEGLVYNAAMRFTQSRGAKDSRIVLIGIDERSLSRFGPWPWPRGLIAEMIDRLHGSDAKLIGLLFPLSHREQNQGLDEIRRFRIRFNAHLFSGKDEKLGDWVLRDLEQMENDLDNDRHLVRSVKDSGNVILAAFGPSGTIPMGDAIRVQIDPYLRKSCLSSPEDPSSLNGIPSTQRLSFPYAELSRTALGVGYGSIAHEEASTRRSHPMVINLNGTLLPSFPLAMAIAYLHQSPNQVHAERNRLRLRDFDIPLFNGKMLIRYRGKDPFQRYSFADLADSQTALPELKGKIAIIGANSGEMSPVRTPVSTSMSPTELMAEVLSNTLDRRFIKRPNYMGFMEAAVLWLSGGLAVLLFPQTGQLIRLGTLTAMTVLLLTVEVLSFSLADTWIKTGFIISALLSIYLFVVLRQFFLESIAKGPAETNRLIGLGFQSRGFLDLALEEFRKLPLSDKRDDLIYDLGLEYEKGRMFGKALAAYAYINNGERYVDLHERILKLKKSADPSAPGDHDKGEEANIRSGSEGEVKTSVGRYKIEGVLGKGAMGIVYKATDPKINRTVAVKTIRFSDEFDDDVIRELKQRFFREAEIAGQLSHPSIVTIYDVGDDGDLTYIAMEYLEGEDFDHYVNKGNLLPFRKVLYVVEKIADALDYAHKSEVIHRDIKPANIMLLRNGQIKITDFGIAKAISSSRTRTGLILGTPNYMSPEQIMGQKIDHRSDLFSLGVLFFQLLTGELPFHGKNLSGLLYQITQSKHPPVRSLNPRIPKACEQLIDKAMAKNPNERFGEAGDMAKMIRRLAYWIDMMMKKKRMGNHSVSKAR